MNSNSSSKMRVLKIFSSDAFLSYYKVIWDFPSSPVVKTPPSHSGSVGSIPSQGTKITHASWLKHQDVKQKQYCR